MFKNLIVGVDHREGGRDAVALAQQLVSRASTLTVAHVYTGDPYVYRGVSSEYAAYERKRDLERMAQARADAGAEAEIRWHRASSVGCGLHELCEALHADLLVVGAPHRHGFGHLLEYDAGRALRDSFPRAIAIAPVGYRCEPSTIDEVGVGYTGSRHEPRCAPRGAGTGERVWQPAFRVRGDRRVGWCRRQPGRRRDAASGTRADRQAHRRGGACRLGASV